MTEKTLTELIETRQEVWIAMLDARIRRAEAAERLAEFAAMHHQTGATEDVYEAAERLLSEYKAAREAVRKLEEQT